MRRPAFHPLVRRAGWTLTELLIAMSITVLLSAGLITGVISVEKSYYASRQHITAQAEQMLLLDYMGLDLRRALTATAANSELTITIPDYYAANGTPRDPTISGSTAIYGATPRTVRYYKTGDTIFRNEAGVATALARSVSDFQLTFQNLGQSVRVSISFVPTFQFTTTNREARRLATTTFATTLLRNKR